MKTIYKIAVLALLVIGTSNYCCAMPYIVIVPTLQEVQDLGLTIRSDIATNQTDVWLEFSPHGKLENFTHCELEVATNGQKLVCATLLPLQQTSDKVVLHFSADADHLKMSTLTVFVTLDSMYRRGYRIAVKDFVK